MAYSQYSTSSRHFEDNDLESGTQNTNSGSYNLYKIMNSTKHTRMMGRIQNKQLPRRFNVTFASDEAESGTSSTAQSSTPAPRRMPMAGTATSGNRKPTWTQPRRMGGSSGGSSASSSSTGSFPTPSWPQPRRWQSQEPTPSYPASRSALKELNNRQSVATPFAIEEEDETAEREQVDSILSKASTHPKTPQNRPRSRSQPPPTTPKSPGFLSRRHNPSAASSTGLSGGDVPVQKHNSKNCNNNSRLGVADTKTIQVNDRTYSILKVIGKGGSSVVYEVFDEERNLRAIKRVDLSDVDQAQAEGYLNEINMLEKLQGHSRIVRMWDYEFRQEEDLLLVVMERGDVDLATLLSRMSAAGIREVQRKFYWAEMLEAVQAIHDAGIIHSDLKPANFLVVAGTLKLIDFGIASSVQSDKTSVVKDSQMGTFNFMSPEAIEDQGDSEDNRPSIKISRKSDVWSLGCILYQLTYGKLPFRDFRNPIKKLDAIINPNYQIPFPEDGHDPLLIDSIKRCLVRDPTERASVGELQSHPYLQSKSDSSSNSRLTVPGLNSISSAPSDNVKALTLLSQQLDQVLTPNSKVAVSRALQKLSSSETSLDAMKGLNV